jgi:hypothetical protein
VGSAQLQPAKAAPGRPAIPARTAHCVTEELTRRAATGQDRVDRHLEARRPPDERGAPHPFPPVRSLPSGTATSSAAWASPSGGIPSPIGPTRPAPLGPPL